jgi:ATP-dependent DNA ligase
MYNPELVVEIAFNEVQVSAPYPGGPTLRFARVRRCHTDKRAYQAATINAVRRVQRFSLNFAIEPSQVRRIKLFSQRSR